MEELDVGRIICFALFKGATLGVYMAASAMLYEQ